MDNNEYLFAFLRTNGFEPTEKETSEFFGDYFIVFSGSNFQIRLSSDKSIQTIDVRSNRPIEDWYDLPLVKNLLYNEKNLTARSAFEQQIHFLERELLGIIELFNEKNYPDTRNRLIQLGDERARQMFP